MDVPFDVVHGDERYLLSETECFGIGDADEQRADEARARGDSDSLDSGEIAAAVFESLADDGDDGA